MSENQSEKKQEISKEPVSDIEIENEKQAEQVKQVVVEAIRSEFSGPMPPPSILSGYEKILPGAADRILSMAEKQSAHRQKMEEKMIKTESRDSLLGVLFAFFSRIWLHSCGCGYGNCSSRKCRCYFRRCFRRYWNWCNYNNIYKKY